MNQLEQRLLNDFQRGFPLCAEPFAEIARRCDAAATEVISAYRRLAARGAVSRIGGVFAPNCIGASTLAAMRVPDGRVAEVARRVSAHPEVNHNYEREHLWNLWFVATAPDEARLAAALTAIEQECGIAVMRLPLEEDFHIDLGFDLLDGTVPARGARAPARRLVLGARERALVGALQPGLTIVARPYAELAARAGMTQDATIAQIGRWLEAGAIKRFGVVVRHHELGFGANAMVVFDVPDPEVGRVGRDLAAEKDVTLCYRRPRMLPEWPYNLFCMVHGRSRDAVLAQLAALRERCGLGAYAQEILFSARRFKQRGARYVEEAAAHG